MAAGEDKRGTRNAQSAFEYDTERAAKRVKSDTYLIEDLKRLLLCITINRYRVRPDQWIGNTLHWRNGCNVTAFYGTCAHPDDPKRMTFNAWAEYVAILREMQALTGRHEFFETCGGNLLRLCREYVYTENECAERMAIGYRLIQTRFSQLCTEIHPGFSNSYDAWCYRKEVSDVRIPGYWAQAILANARYEENLSVYVPGAFYSPNTEYELLVNSHHVHIRRGLHPGTQLYDAFENGFKKQPHRLYALVLPPVTPVELASGFIRSLFDNGVDMPAPGVHLNIDEHLLALSERAPPEPYPATVLAQANKRVISGDTGGARYTLHPDRYWRPSEAMLRYVCRSIR